MPGTCFKILLLFLLGIGQWAPAKAQITITPDTGALRLVQKMLSNGVSISNCRFKGANGAAGMFQVVPTSTPLGIDSGIVLSTGYVKSNFMGTNLGIDAPSNNGTVSNNLHQPGDSSLATISLLNFDAAVLEFDFVPAGDSILFRYVFASDEYPLYNCSKYNDVFAFFITGPGITGSPNIALVPGTNIPVSINSINDGTTTLGNGTPMVCSMMGLGSPFTQLYIKTGINRYIAYNGFTKVLEARAAVQPCQTYHLKLAIADGGDPTIDSGVFLEAKSFRSSGLVIENANPISSTGQPYLAEGCTSGGFRIKRRKTDAYALPVALTYGGTAINGTDVPLLPALAIIPANDSVVFIPISAIADQLAEGIELLKVYVGNGCSTGAANYLDSLEIQIRDYDTLHLLPAGSTGICKNGSLPLQATGSYTSYTWQPAALLSNATIANPIASPLADSTSFVCTAVQGNCVAKDSVKLVFKKLFLVAKQDALCRNFPGGGEIKLRTNGRWQQPVVFWVNGQTPQSDSTLSNLPAGTYTAYAKDATNCIDSLSVTLAQRFPNLVAGVGSLVQASCTNPASGSATISAMGGAPPYFFSLNGIAYQAANTLPAPVGNHFAIVKDNNNCIDTAFFQILFNNPLVVDAGPDTIICEGTSITLQASANTGDISWLPATALSNAVVLQPQATPATTTLYHMTAQYANCQRSDSVLITVRPAPVANAGADTAVCTGGSVQLHGSGGIRYQWLPSTYLNDPQSASPIVTPSATTRYRLTVTDANNCTALQLDEVQVRAVPAVIAFAGNDTVAVAGQPLQLIGQQIGNPTATQYNWLPAVGLDNPNVLTPIARLAADQTYRLMLRTPQGCEGHDDISIKVYKEADIYVPTGFTPNGDGRNDVLRAIPIGIQTFRYFRLYNRWGQLVFATTTPATGWDGKINGNFQYGQSFVWMTEGIDYAGRLIKRTGSVVVVQ